MTIITLLDVKTKKKVIVRSVIDPIARIDKKGNIQIIQIHKWLYDESGDFVDEDLIYAELSGDFPLGDSRQPIYKSLRPFDLVS
ncbi:hypothetical protein OZZ14_17995 [Acinetobacter baumannii]|nr:hypothetical protein [Acinetobacter baumannii]MCZ0699318.1 hypothetical protein [Acinetobacter baumannii]